MNADIDLLVKQFTDLSHDFSIFMKGVVEYLGHHPNLRNSEQEVVHSYKSRLKNPDHLRDKIIRKQNAGRLITTDNLFSEITDLAGVRIIHLFQEHFAQIDAVVRHKIAAGDWWLAEKPKAYTWDPEVVSFFNRFDLDVIQKPTSYTSVHYLIRPREDSPLCCEVQVRTLFEEIWGEVDHQINYPQPTDNLACKEQIQVLSKIIGAGSRLLDSLQRVNEQARNEN